MHVQEQGCAGTEGVVLRSCISRGCVQMRWFARPGGGCTSSVPPRLHTGACNFQRKRPSRGCGPYKLLCKYARAWLRARKHCPVIQAAAFICVSCSMLLQTPRSPKRAFFRWLRFSMLDQSKLGASNRKHICVV